MLEKRPRSLRSQERRAMVSSFRNQESHEAQRLHDTAGYSKWEEV